MFNNPYSLIIHARAAAAGHLENILEIYTQNYFFFLQVVFEPLIAVVIKPLLQSVMTEILLYILKNPN